MLSNHSPIMFILTIQIFLFELFYITIMNTLILHVKYQFTLFLL